MKSFALILTNHRLWGSVLLPYLIQSEPNKRYYKLIEVLTPFPGTDTLGSLTPDERDIVKTINEYSDRKLFTLFSKDKSVKDFTEKVSKDIFEQFIRPYIERRIYKCLTIARDENIPVYYQKKKSGTLHSEDQLTLSGENASPVFRFIRNEEDTRYNLSLESGGQLIDLLKDSVDILCISPCLIRDDYRILFVSDVDGSKIRPFLSKDSIIIPKKTEDKYFKSFVLNAVNNFRVEGTGFKIEIIEPDKKAILEMETGIKGKSGPHFKISVRRK